MITEQEGFNDEIVYKKAMLFVPATEENINFYENNLSLITEGAVEVEVEMCEDETEITIPEMYDIWLNGNRITDVAGEHLILRL